MKGFRRSRPLSIEPGQRAAAPRSQIAARTTTVPLPREDTRPILVAVDGSPRGWDALEWAVAEAAARQTTLRIVHVINRLFIPWDAFGGVYLNQQDAGDREVGTLVMKEAASRALLVAPALPITTHLLEGATSAVVLREGRRDALIVVGRGRDSGGFTPFNGAAGLRVARLARAPVAVIELFDEASQGRSAGRVVVGVDGVGDSTAVLEFAFGAARRRGVGLTVLHPVKPRMMGELDEEIGGSPADEFLENGAVRVALWGCRDAYPDVDVRQRYVQSSVGSALVAESTGAALVVLGSRARGRLRNGLLGPERRIVLRFARSPVAIVRTVRTRRRG